MKFINNGINVTEDVCHVQTEKTLLSASTAVRVWEITRLHEFTPRHDQFQTLNAHFMTSRFIISNEYENMTPMNMTFSHSESEVWDHGTER